MHEYTHLHRHAHAQQKTKSITPQPPYFLTDTDQHTDGRTSTLQIAPLFITTYLTAWWNHFKQSISTGLTEWPLITSLSTCKSLPCGINKAWFNLKWLSGSPISLETVGGNSHHLLSHSGISSFYTSASFSVFNRHVRICFTQKMLFYVDFLKENCPTHHLCHLPCLKNPEILLIPVEQFYDTGDQHSSSFLLHKEATKPKKSGLLSLVYESWCLSAVHWFSSS